jgi:hypothetical protein
VTHANTYVTLHNCFISPVIKPLLMLDQCYGMKKFQKKCFLHKLVCMQKINHCFSRIFFLKMVSWCWICIFWGSLYRKYKFCIVQPNLCCTIQIAAFQFVLYGQIFLSWITKLQTFMYDTYHASISSSQNGKSTDFCN